MDTKLLAKNIRRWGLRMTSSGGSSHIGSILSVADIVAVLYGRIMRVNPQDPTWEERDRFILSKGHAGAAVYAALAELGFFPTDRLGEHYRDGSKFSGHISHKGIPGVELSTGSLGHGLGVGVGMALGIKKKGGRQRVYVVMSDGECDEGSVWEAALFAQHHKLDNLTVVIDYNKIQSLAYVADTVALEPFGRKWDAFNWHVAEADGHDHDALIAALEAGVEEGAQKPRIIIAHTTKGKGVSFMEDSVLWHYRTARGDELERAAKELET